MGDKTGLRVVGDRELIRAMDRIESKARRRVATKSARAAGAPVVKAAKQHAKGIGDRYGSGSSDMWRYIGQRVKAYAKRGVTVSVIGPMYGKWKGAYRAKYGRYPPTNIWWLLEYGTAPRRYKGRKMPIVDRAGEDGDVVQMVHPGHAPQPFIRPAYRDARHAARKASARKFADELSKAVLQEARATGSARVAGYLPKGGNA